MADQDISAPQSDEEFLGVKEHPAWRGRVLWAALGLGAILLIVLAAHFLKKSDGPSYATQPVSRGALTTSVSATGKLAPVNQVTVGRSEEHTSELQSLMRISYAVLCLKKKKT